jgi:hypothetical protein
MKQKAGIDSDPRMCTRHPYVGIIQIRLWVEVVTSSQPKLPVYSVYLFSITTKQSFVKFHFSHGSITACKKNLLSWQPIAALSRLQPTFRLWTKNDQGIFRRTYKNKT